MKVSIHISLLILALSFLGALANLVLGFGLTKDVSAASDQHLSIALVTIFTAVAGGVGLIRFSKLLLEEVENLLTKDPKHYDGIYQQMKIRRMRAMNSTLVSIALLILSLISGTISQSGRFPLLHGALGFAVIASQFFSLQQWIKLLKRTWH